MNHEIIETPEVEENEQSINWKSLIIYASVMVGLSLGLGFLITGITKDFVYVELIVAIFGIISLLLMMIRIRARDSRNYKKNKSIVEDKNTVAYKNWKAMQFCCLIVGVVLLLLSLLFFYLFRAN